jgi:hypothetical protein
MEEMRMRFCPPIGDVIGVGLSLASGFVIDFSTAMICSKCLARWQLSRHSAESFTNCRE